MTKDYGLWARYYRLEVETFKATVIDDTVNAWVIAYIDPACGGCKRLAVEYEKVTTVEQIKMRRVKFGYVDITIPVEEGPRFRIRNFDVMETDGAGNEVETIAPKQELRKMVKLKKGDWFSRSKIAEGIEEIRPCVN